VGNSIASELKSPAQPIHALGGYAQILPALISLLIAGKASRALSEVDSPAMATTAPIYSIGAVARMIGVPAATIRTWEERYGFVSPARSQGGQRLYTRDEIEQLRFVKSRIANGVSPAAAHRLLAERPLRPDANDRAGGPRVLILLAERDRYAAAFEEFFLRTEGFEIELCFDASEAEQKAIELVPQLVIVELLISGGTGAELCRRLKAKLSEPILAISTLEARDAALAAGADAFLHKPIDPLQLVSAAKDLLGISAFLDPDI
jgi:DNA-binding transcriptional MerR regulator